MIAKKDTIIRTVILAVALINQILISFGYNIIPINDEDLSNFLSLAFTIIAAVVSWWKNNSFSQEAVAADELLKELKINKKRGV